MTKEVHFIKRWRMLSILVLFFLGVEALSFPQQLRFLKEGKIVDFLFIQIILLTIGLGLCWNHLMQRFMRFYEDGISYIRFFKRHFLKWEEITEVIDLESEYSPTILNSKTVKIRVFTTEYKQARGLKNFIRKKVLEASNNKY